MAAEDEPFKGELVPMGGEKAVDWVSALAAGGILVASTTPAAILLAATLPVMAKTAYEMDKKAFRRRMIRGGQALSTAAEELHIDIPALAARADESDARTELLARAIEAAASTVTLEQKIDALGRALAMGMDDDAKLDESVDFVRVLNEIEVSHFKVLVALFELPEVDTDKHRRSWEAKQIEELSGIDVKNTAIMSTLVSNGTCLQDYETYNTRRDAGPDWRITGFGKAVLELLGYDPAIKQAAERHKLSGIVRDY